MLKRKGVPDEWFREDGSKLGNECHAKMLPEDDAEMKTYGALLIALLLMLAASGCGTAEYRSKTEHPGPEQPDGIRTLNTGTPNLTGGKEAETRESQPLTLAELHAKYPTYFVLNGSSAKRQVALTFDDAPDAWFTPQVLDVLKKYKVRATFFVMGVRAESHPDVVKRMIREGHEVGNHSYDHPNLPHQSDAAFHRQVERTSSIIRTLTGRSPHLFRPPYGNISEGQIQWLASQKYRVVNWNVDSLDWKGLSADQVSANVLAHVRPGSIVLQHAAGGEGENLAGTVGALPGIIEKLQGEGFQLVTVSELLGLPVSRP